LENALNRKQAVAKQRAEQLVELLRARRCADCGESDPLVLEFDHLGNKRFGIAKGLRDRNWQAVRDEIDKCDVVCANCHRRRTARPGGFARVAALETDGRE
jgi:hypothetical protein